MNRLDALTVRESNGKSYWTRVGVAFQSKDGDGWNVLLDAMPAPTDGQFKIMLRPPKQDSRQASTPPDDFSDIGDGPIPF